MPFQGPDATVHAQCDLYGWLLDWLVKLDDKELSITVMIMYQAWLARNEARNEIQIAAPSVIVCRSLSLLEGIGGSGVILRAHHGRFFGGSSRFFSSIPHPEQIELLACKEALIPAREKEIQRVCLSRIACDKSSE
jgi:hypothetical protein